MGINYQAVTPNLAAPTQSAIATTVVSLIKTYPVGDVIQTGYNTLNFGESVTGNVANGCGDGMNELLDRLDDLRGSSGDIYLGSLPPGILNTPGNSVGGCAPQGGKTAATFVDYSISPIGDVPHEVGHALDRHHAPCASGCSVSPADPDSNYPQYNSFRSDSIGVFGFDPTSNSVFPPAQYSDMMAYFFPQWISPYTYNGLRGSSFHPVGGSPSPGASPHFREDMDFDLLFLRLIITRERKVTRIPSFNFAAKLLNRERCGKFVAELQDKHRQPLSCVPLHCGCDAGCQCWPKRIRDVVPFSKGSSWLVIYEGDKVIYEEEIKPEPVVKIKSAEAGKDGVKLVWSTDFEGDLWYLVHWYDDRFGVWRGVAPRQQKRELLVPRRLFARSEQLKVRVLATPGLGTGMAEQVIKLSDYTPDNPKIVVLGVDTAQEKPMSIPDVLVAMVIDSAGRQLPGDGMIWFGDGQVIGRGSQVDLRVLGEGRHQVRLVPPVEAGVAARTWLVEHAAAGYRLHHEACDPKPAFKGLDHKHPHPAPHDPCGD